MHGFPFSGYLSQFFLLSQRLVCVSGSEIKVVISFMQCFPAPYSNRNNTHTHVHMTKYEVCDFSNSAYLANALVFAFNTNTAPFNIQR